MGHTSEELRGLIDELRDLWARYGGPQPMHQPAARRGKPFEGTDLARITSVLGLARHVHDTARAVLTLVDAEMSNAAVPLVRVAFESALTSVWLVQGLGDHGIRAFLHEYSRGRAALRQDALASASAAFREGAPSIANADTGPFAGSWDSTRQFHDICLDLKPAGKDAYVYYRIFSSYSHATAGVADLYFTPAPESEIMPCYRDTPEAAVNTELLLFFTAVSMLWAARAVSYMTQDKHHRSALRQIARALEVESDMQLSDRYRLRHAKQGRAERTG